MKRIWKSLLVLAVFCLFTLGAAADEQIRVYLDGKEIAFDTPPTIINDNTLVPMRAVFEALGAEVQWNDEKQCVTANRYDTEIKLFVNDNVLYRNYFRIYMPCSSQLINDRVYVPVRAIAESFGCHVDWCEESNAVAIFTEKAYDRICGSMELLLGLVSNGFSPYYYNDVYAVFLEKNAPQNDLSKVKLLVSDDFAKYTDPDDESNCMRTVIINNGQPDIADHYRQLISDCTPSVYEAWEYVGFNTIEELRSFYAEYMAPEFWDKSIERSIYLGKLFEFDGKLYKALDHKYYPWIEGCMLIHRTEEYNHKLYSIDENGFSLVFATEGGMGYWPPTKFIMKNGVPYIESVGAELEYYPFSY